MGPAAILNIVITASNATAMAKIAQTDAAMKKSAATAQSAAATTAASYARTGQKLSRIGAAMTRYLTVPAAIAGAASVKLAMDFEESMTHVQTLAGTSAKTMEGFREEVLKMGPELGKSPRELAEALYFIRSSGIKAADSLEVLRTTAMASAVGLGETKVVADAVTSAMNAYRRSHLSAADATEVLMKTVKFGKGEPEELAASIGRVIPVASKLKVPFNDVGASLAGLTLQGLDAAEATTALRGVFMALLKPTADGNEALAKVGLSAEGLRKILEQQGTLAMLQTLSDRFKGNEEAMAKVFPNVRALVGAFNLTGDSAKRNSQIFQDMQKQTDFLGAKFKETSETDAFKMKQAMASLETTAIKLGSVLLPVVAKIARAFASLFSIIPPGGLVAILGVALVVGPIVKLVGWVYKLRAAWITVRGAATAAAGAQAAASAAGAAGGAGGIGARALAARAAPVGLAVGAAAAAAAGFYVLMEKTGNRSDEIQESWAQLHKEVLDSSNSAGALVTMETKLNQTVDGIRSGQILVTDEVRRQVFHATDVLYANQKISRENALQWKTLTQVADKAGVIGRLLAQIGGAGVGPLKQYGDQAVSTINKIVAAAQKTNLADKLMPPSLQERVGTALEGVYGIFKSKLNKIAGITQKDMLFIAMHMQQGPERGREAMNVIFDKMVGNLKAAMDNGEITVKKGVSQIMAILKQQAEWLGIPYKPLSWLPDKLPGNVPGTWQGGKPPKSQLGMIVPGHTSGDSVLAQALVEPGELLAVVNRNAAKGLMAWNQMIPRRKAGGVGAIPTFPSSVSPAFIDNIALGAANVSGDMARRWLKKHKPKGGPIGGGSAEWQAIDALANQFGNTYHTGMTNRLGEEGSWHGVRGAGGRSRATDYSGGNMLTFAKKVAKRYGSNLLELIHTPLGFSIDNGQRTAPFATAAHYDHVHVAMQKGGTVPAPKHGSHWIKGGSRWDMNEAATLLWQAGLSPSQASDLSRVIGQESGGDPHAGPSSAGAKGLFQILTQTFPGNLYDPRINAINAAKLYQARGMQPWVASQSGWASHGGHILQAAVGAGKTAAKVGTAAGKATAKAAEWGWSGAGPTNEEILERLQAEVDRQNERRGAINELRKAGNLEALQRYQVGMAQNPMLGLGKPGMPTLAGMMDMLPPAALAPTRGGGGGGGPGASWGWNPGKGRKKGRRAGFGFDPVIVIEDGAVDAKRIKMISGFQAKKKMKRAGRRANRPLPSRGGGI